MAQAFVPAPTLAEFLLARIAEDEAANPVTLWELRWPISPNANRGYMRGRPTTATHQWFLTRETALHVQAKSTKPSILAEVPRSGKAGQVARRIRSECEAKRRIVELYAAPDPHDPGESCPDCLALRFLAAVYAEHPDYRDEWKP